MPLHAGLTSRAFSHHLNIKEAKGCHIKTSFKTKSKAQWTPVAVRRILTNPVYVGTLVQGIRTRPNYKIKTVIVNEQDKWAIYENAHEAIINPRQFVLVQRFLSLIPGPPHAKTDCSHWQGFSVAVIVAALWCVKRRPPATSVSATIPVVTTRIPENVPRTVSPKSNWRMPSFGFYKSIFACSQSWMAAFRQSVMRRYTV